MQGRVPLKERKRTESHPVHFLMPTLSDLIGWAVWDVPVQVGPILWSLSLVASFREAGGLGICKKPLSLENTVKDFGRAAWGWGLSGKMVPVASF